MITIMTTMTTKTMTAAMTIMTIMKPQGRFSVYKEMLVDCQE